MKIFKVLFVFILCIYPVFPKNVAVIGAGISGLAAAKNSIDKGYTVTIFEQSEQLGGIWRYTDKVGEDEYGVPIHSPMYQELKALGPHKSMEYPDYPFPEGTEEFPSHTVVYKYLGSYADKFKLRNRLQLHHLVTHVSPLKDGKWAVTVKDVKQKIEHTINYDVVFVCVGYVGTPYTPEIPDRNKFQKKQIHSHDFRTADTFRDDDVLVIGGGISGMDMVRKLTGIAKSITISVHQKDPPPANFYQSADPKGEVSRFTENEATFADGSHKEFSAVIFATGYNYRFQFLSPETGVEIDEKKNAVTPLYKQIFNINHPTMAFIGVPIGACAARLQDLQVRFAMKFISGEKVLPSKREMREDMDKEISIHSERNPGARVTHNLKGDQKMYCTHLADTAGIENIPEGICWRDAPKH